MRIKKFICTKNSELVIQKIISDIRETLVTIVRLSTKINV